MQKVFLLGCLLFCAQWSAAGVYKYVDEKGNTVYSDTKPKGDQAVEKIPLKSQYTNSMPAQPSSGQGEDGEPEIFNQLQQQQSKQRTYEQSKREARKAAFERVKSAEGALETAKEVKAGDMFPNKNGGIRYTQQYLERIEAAQLQVDEAKKQYSKY